MVISTNLTPPSPSALETETKSSGFSVRMTATTPLFRSDANDFCFFAMVGISYDF